MSPLSEASAINDGVNSSTNSQSMPDSMPDSMPNSMWALKPWWCQPWSIILTGILIPSVSWVLLHRLWISLPVAAVMVVWWILFLVVVPTQYAAAVKEQRDIDT
ncbi:MAG: DUF6737 family protein [Cyanobacteria bacterium J06621_11]